MEIEKLPVRPTGWGGPYKFEFYGLPLLLVISVPIFVVQMISLAENVTISVVLSLLYAFATIGMIVFWWITTSSDPTDKLVDGKHAAKDDADYASRPFECAVCLTAVCKTAKHCRSCNRCVDDFDHHCPYVNNCIGG